MNADPSGEATMSHASPELQRASWLTRSSCPTDASIVPECTRQSKGGCAGRVFSSVPTVTGLPLSGQSPEGVIDFE
jgi:hypothetical protein